MEFGNFLMSLIFQIGELLCKLYNETKYRDYP